MVSVESCQLGSGWIGSDRIGRLVEAMAQTLNREANLPTQSSSPANSSSKTGSERIICRVHSLCFLLLFADISGLAYEAFRIWEIANVLSKRIRCGPVRFR